MEIMTEKINRAPLMIVHHMKNLVSVCISIILPPYLSASLSALLLSHHSVSWREMPPGFTTSNKTRIFS